MTTYLITGASSGIGEALSCLICAKGDTVFGIARRKEVLDNMAVELGERFIPFVCDVTDKEAVRSVCANLPQLPDVVILNAGVGIYDKPDRPDVTVHEQTFAVNYFGVLNWIDALYPRFAERKSGAFVATSSLAGYRGLPLGCAYSASKGAISNAMEAFRLTYQKDGVEFINVHPGFIDTPMTRKQTNPMPLKWPVEKAARAILRGIEKRKLNINFPWPIWLALTITRLFPPRFYRRVMSLQ